MAHITVEFSKNLEDQHNIDVLVERVHAAAGDHPAVPVDGLRTRAVAQERYRVADCDPRNAFLAITARIGPGRSPEDKKSFLLSVLDAAQQHLEQESDELDIMYSMEVQEIDAEFRVNRNEVKTRMAADSAVAASH